jgi:two-component system, cell cycle response regulator
MNDSSSRAKILVVDDSKLIRKSASKILSEEFDVVQAEDGEEAWQLITSDDSIQVVFSDLDMPNLNGFGLLERIRTHPNAGIAELPVVIVTGAEKDEEAKFNALQRGATDFITKPFKSTDIVARARAHADYQRTTRALANAAAIDTLTGLANQNAFAEKLDKDLSFCHRHHHPLAVAVFEVSDFRALFMDVGRQGADVIIKEIAKVIDKTVRREDTVSRYTMARFAVSLPTAKHEGLTAFSERIINTVAKFNVRRKGEPISVGMTAGIIAFETVTQDLTWNVVMQQAEQALLTAQSTHVPLHIATRLASMPQPAAATFSIDQLLAEIGQGKAVSTDTLYAAIRLLQPMVQKMDDSQRKLLLAI